MKQILKRYAANAEKGLRKPLANRKTARYISSYRVVAHKKNQVQYCSLRVKILSKKIEKESTLLNKNVPMYYIYK